MQMWVAPGCFMFFNFKRRKLIEVVLLQDMFHFFDLYPFLVDGQKTYAW